MLGGPRAAAARARARRPVRERREGDTGGRARARVPSALAIARRAKRERTLRRSSHAADLARAVARARDAAHDALEALEQRVAVVAAAKQPRLSAGAARRRARPAARVDVGRRSRRRRARELARARDREARRPRNHRRCDRARARARRGEAAMRARARAPARGERWVPLLGGDAREGRRRRARDAEEREPGKGGPSRGSVRARRARGPAHGRREAGAERRARSIRSARARA